MKLTYYGHSCFSVNAGGKILLFDPFITGNELAKDINVESINADYILVSHGHFDHTLDVVTIANRTGAKVLGVWELYEHFTKAGLKNVHPINPGGQFSFDFGTVKSVSANHSSSFQDGTYAGVAAGFVIKTEDGNFYYSGDTALNLDMTLIPKWANLDFAILPIGDNLTMGTDDAVEAAKMIKVDKVLGVHYDTFGFIRIDKQQSIDKFRQSGIQLHLPAIGKTVDL
ncbi:metal-dependent hydrolase [Dyadobacter subterraneus]|uniref:Metal-dependent hydrolase n=1 Tax=Dyadobacter subterraneus TaxID=2773304 RepID=A0ABR9WBZ8_9BACT|nr:metal-dependent hydrolase [Dyadobacter subterraneus]MBE9461886.1 metal-dependent hydrolase [Dyadobacter subterraneus]